MIILKILFDIKDESDDIDDVFKDDDVPITIIKDMSPTEQTEPIEETEEIGKLNQLNQLNLVVIMIFKDGSNMIKTWNNIELLRKLI